jgi:hypothetical protein
LLVVLTWAAQTSKRRPAMVGNVFYARGLVGIVGDTCSGAVVRIELIPPLDAGIFTRRPRRG